MTSHVFFITGTDTDAGKTRIACALLHAARIRSLTTAAGKPVASGSAVTPAGLRNDDALALQAECHPALDYAALNPIALAPAIAPHLAAREAGVALTVENLSVQMRTLMDHQRDFTLIEGAGGWRVPLNDTESLSDLANVLKLPVILVVGVRLGCLNHARLTAEAIAHDGLELAGWVGNVIEPHTARLDDNLASLDHWLPAPCLGVVPHLPAPASDAIASYLTLDVLLGENRTTTTLTEKS
ncbi:dethiobiotin synthase [Phytohalomonas tamaricis]|uniref:dethiobiotin synthase n=1 Tax=Phytohalomonas tamaricis TaxID=2081032 RepID=UPI000D0AE38B|nr:dethiobiotin synthase [Phytohalomonas tamaricis]